MKNIVPACSFNYHIRYKYNKEHCDPLILTSITDFPLKSIPSPEMNSARSHPHSQTVKPPAVKLQWKQNENKLNKL